MAKYLDEDDFMECSNGSIPAKIMSGQAMVVRMDESHHYVTMKDKLAAPVEFMCKWMMLLMVAVAAFVALTGGAGLAVILAAVAVGAAVGGALGSLLCGVMVSMGRQWIGQKNTVLIGPGQVPAMPDTGFMTCPIMGGHIMRNPNIKSWTDALIIFAGNVVKNVLIGFAVGAGAALLWPIIAGTSTIGALFAPAFSGIGAFASTVAVNLGISQGFKAISSVANLTSKRYGSIETDEHGNPYVTKPTESWGEAANDEASHFFDMEKAQGSAIGKVFTGTATPSDLLTAGSVIMYLLPTGAKKGTSEPAAGPKPRASDEFAGASHETTAPKQEGTAGAKNETAKADEAPAAEKNEPAKSDEANPTAEAKPSENAPAKQEGDRTGAGEEPTKLKEGEEPPPNKEGCNDPINPVNGANFTDAEDFAIHGKIPFVWKRSWHSNIKHYGILGHGWFTNHDIYLEEQTDFIEYKCTDGRTLFFTKPTNEQVIYKRSEKLELQLHGNSYCIKDANGLKYWFSKNRQSNNRYLLTKITNPANNGFLQYFYDDKNLLTKVTDTEKRSYHIFYHSNNCVTYIKVDTTDDNARLPERLVSYTYDANDNLHTAANALGNKSEFYYDGHLMVKKVLKNRHSFNYEYDGKDFGAKCIKVYGDDGVWPYLFQYFTTEKKTIVTNALGLDTIYHYNDYSLQTKIEHPDGTIEIFSYNEHRELLSYQHSGGNSADYFYNDKGFVVSVARNGQSEGFIYDEDNRLSIYTDVAGNEWEYAYNLDGQLATELAPDGNQTAYEYENRLLKKVLHPNGQHTALRYDENNYLCKATLPNGAQWYWTYDALGNNTCRTDPQGNEYKYEYDNGGRVISVTQPDGTRIKLGYTPGDLINAVSTPHTQITMRYNLMDQMISRAENGLSTHFKYNDELQLIAITNEKGDKYLFELDAMGRAVKETGFDGLEKKYYRDALGRIKQEWLPGNEYKRYYYNEQGRIAGIRYTDGKTDAYQYDAYGNLTIAENSYTSLQWKRDQLGRVVEETQGKHTLTHAYDKYSRRIQLQTSMGANIHYSYDADGLLQELIGNNGQLEAGWQMRQKRDIMGREVERIVVGLHHVQQWAYDSMGRPTLQKTWNKGRQTGQRQYTWATENRLAQVEDQLEKIAAKYSYDNRGFLTGASFEDGKDDKRLPDAAGNLYETEKQKDRVYGKAGQLIKKGGIEYHYDERGNLVLKIKPGRQVWRYQWNSAGMLEKVTNTDGADISFGYDALGRRIWKRFRNTITRWIWDGNVPLQEWKEHAATGQILSNSSVAADGVITWLYSDDSFTPVARLKSKKRHSIVADHLGTPTAMYDEDGNISLSIELDSYGKLRKSNYYNQHEDIAMPFRYQGQYADNETGLYYNRFRYYSAEDGMYISQDPIGLNGNNPTLYGYVHDTNGWLDVFGLDPGGSYGQTRATSSGGQVNHMPANAAVRKAGAGITPYSGPATWMEAADHMQTASWGSRTTASQWRSVQEDLIKRGKYGKAMEMDIRDVERKFGNKYDKGMKQMIDYAVEKEYISRAEGNRLKREYLCPKA
ncbi:MAG: DUF6531 domain-containing protein [Chitinophagaceae bacterium]